VSPRLGAESIRANAKTRRPISFEPQPPAPSAGSTLPGDASGARATHVLAVGWEPAFCDKYSDKNECRVLTSSSFAGTLLSLHGLWPQPRGTHCCNVPADVRQIDGDHNWDGLPEPGLSAYTLKRLEAVMPGVQSKLERHEWIVHGTCFGSNAEGYFARAAGLSEAIDASTVSKLFADSVGRPFNGREHACRVRRRLRYRRRCPGNCLLQRTW
jgi:ribonuclease T2